MALPPRLRRGLGRSHVGGSPGFGSRQANEPPKGANEPWQWRLYTPPGLRPSCGLGSQGSEGVKKSHFATDSRRICTDKAFIFIRVHSC